MNVYVVPYAAEPKFKIGKANDILDRLQCLGLLTNFNLDESLCIRLQSEEDAHRVEKILHRLFEEWNIPFDKANRYDGDTEQFEIACLPRLVRFLNENADLFNGVFPQTLPEAQPRVTRAKLTRQQWHEARANAVLRRQAAQNEYFRMAMAALSCGVDQLRQMGFEVLEKTDALYPFISIESADGELFERAIAIMDELAMLKFLPEHLPLTRTYVFRDVYGGWNEERRRWTGIGILESRALSDKPWPAEYLEILDRIPTSSTQRRPLDRSQIKERGYGT